ncbi:MAG: phospholipase D-like domain-containing protein, partial [Clostridia bacterium]
MKKLLKTRTKLSPIRLEILGRGCKAVETWLRGMLSLEREQCFKSLCPLRYSFVSSVGKYLPPDAEFARLTPIFPATLVREAPIIPQIRTRDALLYLPYNSVRPLLHLLAEAAECQDTVSIKICLYRLAEQSQIIELLCDAAENGIDVTIVLELRARFDERNNINWSNRLEEAGCTVLYGIDDYKVHSKILLVTIKSGDEIQYITHVGTGNYNEKTARQYTDIGLLTADPVIGADAVAFFQNLALSSLTGSYRALIPAPGRLKDALLSLISDEIAKAAA